MRIAQIARPGAIYDASASSKTFTEWQIADLQVGKEEFPKIDEREMYAKK